MDENFVLNEQDLSQLFGKTVVQKYFADLEKATQENKPQKFEQIIRKMEQERQRQISSIYRQAVKFSHSCPGKTTDQKEIRDVAEKMTASLEKEFEGVFYPNEKLPPSRLLKAAFATNDECVDTTQQTFKKFIEHSRIWNSAISTYETNHQRTHGNFDNITPRYQDLHQQPELSRLEEKFLIDIRTDIPLKLEQLKLLEQLLTELKEKRPEDLGHVKIITIFNSEKRSGGSSHEDHIRLYGLFAPPSPQNGLNNGNYAQESIDSYGKFTDDFARQLLFHEWGHAVEEKLVDHDEYDKIYSNEIWHQIMPNAPDCNEWFAEDYSKWISSQGTEVMKYREKGEEVPLYYTRLAFFKKYLPIASTAELNNQKADNR